MRRGKTARARRAEAAGQRPLFHERQLLDLNDIEHGILEKLCSGTLQRNLELPAPVCSAINDW